MKIINPSTRLYVNGQPLAWKYGIEWLKRRPVMMAGAKRMYDLAIEALEIYVPEMNVGDMISRQAEREGE